MCASVYKTPSDSLAFSVPNYPVTTTDLDLELVGTLIDDEAYWKRRACQRWKNLVVDAYGMSWKQL